VLLLVLLLPFLRLPSQSLLRIIIVSRISIVSISIGIITMIASILISISIILILVSLLRNLLWGLLKEYMVGIENM